MEDLFLIVDCETDSLNPFYGQPLSFSAKVIRGREVVDEISLKCRVESSRLPSPKALYVNGFSRHDLSHAMPLRDMMMALHKFIQKHQPITICAYNAKFDFNFAFSHYYQSLVTPDIYQWKTENRVICGLEILKSIFVFRPDLKYIHIPFTLFDAPSFKLEHVCRENGFHFNFHDATEDVNALHEVLELMKAESPAIVSQAIKCSNKSYVKSLISDNPFFCVSLGSGEDLSARVLTPMAFDSTGNNILCCDISAVDPSKVAGISSWEVYLQSKKISIDSWIIRVPINQGKVFFGPEALDLSGYNLSKCNLEELKRRSVAAKRNLHFKEACKDAFAFYSDMFSDSISDNAIEKSMFRGFLDYREKQFIKQFNELPWQDRWAFAENNSDLKTDNRVIRLAKKTILEYDHLLAPKQTQKDYINYCNNRLFNINAADTLPWNNICSALKELDELKENYPNEISRIKEIESYFDERMAVIY